MALIIIKDGYGVTMIIGYVLRRKGMRYLSLLMLWQIFTGRKNFMHGDRMFWLERIKGKFIR